MENASDKLLELLAAFGIGVMVVLGAGFWLFHRMKQDTEKKQAPGNEDRNPPRSDGAD